ncbi:DNA repair protein RecO [Winogradskyella maritima]|uniref:DNA repair protein RecO n=1 Tax=Winogradskyella maritima TaxID=1517766 RepID=A0ABV8AE96_9FLAO|nr:DNA repair protein RecO [Winogradskyella maritima]
MDIKSRAIVLSKLKFKDYDLIVKCYTKHRGAVSYLIKGGLKNSKTAKAKAVYFQPLSQLQIEEAYKVSRDLQYLKEVRPEYIYKSLHTNIYKGSIVLFLSELLTSVLQEEEKNEALYDYLESAFQYLDDVEAYSNFHLLFLLRLTQFLGFYPESSSESYTHFNLMTGQFESQPSGIYSISGKNLTLLKDLLGMDFEALQTIKITAQERQDFLNMLLYYFELHLGSFRKPKSLKILNEVFH